MLWHLSKFSCLASLEVDVKIFTFATTVDLGDKELFGHPKIVPYPYKVN